MHDAEVYPRSDFRPNLNKRGIAKVTVPKRWIRVSVFCSQKVQVSVKAIPVLNRKSLEAIFLLNNLNGKL